MRAMIIDDEQHAIRRLHKLLKQMPVITQITDFTNPLEALNFLKNNRQDILFLDIEMPVNGLEVFNQVMEIEKFIPIIFTTAYDQYAIKAFELNAIDYLLKPFKLTRLQQSVERAIEYHRLYQNNINNKPKDLRIECFKRLTMYYNNKIINANWRTKKADELIAFLVCEQGDFVSKDKIIDNLWPGSDSKKGMSSLYTTLYYIRQQEQVAQIVIPIESVRGKMRINLDNVEIDMLLLSNHYKDYKKNKIIDKNEINVLYRGMLFEEHDYPWAVILQAKYDNMFQELTMNN